jgi:hypothetical protein
LISAGQVTITRKQWKLESLDLPYHGTAGEVFKALGLAVASFRTDYPGGSPDAEVVVFVENGAIVISYTVEGK